MVSEHSFLSSEVAVTDAEKESEARCKEMLNQLISVVKKQTLEMENLAGRMNEIAVGLKAVVQPLGPPVRALPPPVPAPTATLVTAVDHAVAAAAAHAEATLAPGTPTRCSTACRSCNTDVAITRHALSIGADVDHAKADTTPCTDSILATVMLTKRSTPRQRLYEQGGLKVESLIKVWFRELPGGMLDSLPTEEVMQCQSEHDCAQLCTKLDDEMPRKWFDYYQGGVPWMPPWPPPQGHETLLELFHKQAGIRSIMRLVKHPNVLQLFEVKASKSKIYFVLEYAKGGVLFNKIAKWGKLSEDAARRYFHQLISAVDYCHSRGVLSFSPYLSLLRTDELDIIKQIHAQLTLRGLLNGVVVGSALLDAYARLSDIQSAMVVFDSMVSRNIVTWNSILDAYVESDMLDEGLRLFLEMRKHGLAPDEYTVSIMLKAATSSSQIALGMQIHGLAEKMGLNGSTMIGNGLISMYGKHGKLHDSQRGFNTIRKPDPVSWNSMAQSYIQNEELEKALNIFIGMKHAGIRQDEFSFVSAGAVCTSLGWHGAGKAIHADLIKREMSSNAFVGCRLIDMYKDSVTINNARKVFDGIKYKDVITWNSVISAFAQLGDLHQVLNLLSLMTEEMDPDDFTFATILAASANSAAVQLGMQIHAMILKSELWTDTVVANALISMYSKAGFVKEAQKVFSGLTCKNVITWTAMIGGFAQNVCAKKRLVNWGTKWFNVILEREGQPNVSTVGMLMGLYQKTGNLLEAEFTFAKMRECNVKGVNACSAMITLYTRSSLVAKSEDVVESVNILVNSNGQIVRSDVIGELKMRSYLSGMPECKLGLNDRILLEAQGRATKGKAINLDDIKFHQCVRLARFENDRTISFVPPDGSFDLMTYRLSTQVKPLIWVEAQVEKHSRSWIEIMVKARSQFKERSTATNVEIEVPMPCDATNPNIRTSMGSAAYAPERDAMVWKVKSFPGGDYSFVSVWGQAEIQGGRNVTYQLA